LLKTEYIIKLIRKGSIKTLKTNPKIYANIECNDLEFFTP